MSLPNSSAFDPGEGKIHEKLKTVLKIKTLANSIVDLLRPSITDRSLITPQHFRMKIRQVADLFSTDNGADENGIFNKELFEEVRTLLLGEEEKC